MPVTRVVLTLAAGLGGKSKRMTSLGRALAFTRFLQNTAPGASVR